MAKAQAKAFTTYNAHLQGHGRIPIDLKGLTWIVTKKNLPHSERVVGIMTGQKGIRDLELNMDPSESSSVQDISKFFTDELLKKLG